MITVEDLETLKTRFPARQIDTMLHINEFTYGTPSIVAYGNNTNKITIGKFCSIADNVTMLLGGEHHKDKFTTYPFEVLLEKKHDEEYQSKGDITIGNDVWIGRNAFFLSGVTVGDGVVIGANNMVTKDVPSYAVVVGNPMEIKRLRQPEFTGWWNLPLSDIVVLLNKELEL